MQKDRSKRKYSLNVALLIGFQWADLLTTKGMILKHGLQAEANELAKYLFENNPELLELLKLFAIPAILLAVGYLFDKKFPHKRDISILAMRSINATMACIVLINCTATVYRAYRAQLYKVPPT